jgi:hypothetical protein
MALNFPGLTIVLNVITQFLLYGGSHFHWLFFIVQKQDPYGTNDFELFEQKEADVQSFV